MSLGQLKQGRFAEVGDVYVLQLSLITNVLNFTTFSDTIDHEISVTRTFTKEFRYKKNIDPYSSWTALTDPNLAAITAVATDVFLIEIRYTRIGTKLDGVLILDSFKLEAIEVEACIILKVPKDNWDTLYGATKYEEIVDAVAKFNERQYPIAGNYLYLVEDNTLAGLDMEIEKVNNCEDDVNEILSTVFGNDFTKSMFDIEVDMYDGVRS
jgi:hypothetical protein